MHRRYLYTRALTKVAYRIRGLGRVCEHLRTSVASHSAGTTVLIDDFMGELKFYCDLGEHMGSQIFWRGGYSQPQLKLLKRYLSKGAVFIDVGANQGEFSVYAASLIGKNGKVFAFEPVSSVRQKLSRNITINGFDNVTICPWALGSKEEERSIYGPGDAFSDGTYNMGLPTLFKTSERDLPLEQVRVRRLDDVVRETGVDRIDMIKLDIEGGEFEALKGAEAMLRRFRPVLIFEVGRQTCAAAGYAPADILQWMRNVGYRLTVIGETGDIQRGEAAFEEGDFHNILATPATA